MFAPTLYPRSLFPQRLFPAFVFVPSTLPRIVFPGSIVQRAIFPGSIAQRLVFLSETIPQKVLFPGAIVQKVVFISSVAQRVDFSMSAPQFFVQIASNTQLVVQCTDEITGAPINVSTATTIQILLQDPNGVQYTKTGVLDTTGTDGKIRYNTLTTDITVVGVWSIQGFVVLPGSPAQNSYTVVSQFVAKINL